MQNPFGILIQAGGQGKRFGSQKQFYEFRGKTFVQRALETALTQTSRENIVIVGVDVPGGETRNQSIFNGLQEFVRRGNPPKRLVAHQVARPLILPEQLHMICTAESDNCLFGIPCTANIYDAENDRFLPGKNCLEVASPGSCNFEQFYSILKADQKERKYLDNDSYSMSLILREHDPAIKRTVLRGDRNLFKVTYPSDIAILERLADEFGIQ